jgi:hypothetical protein
MNDAPEQVTVVVIDLVKQVAQFFPRVAHQLQLRQQLVTDGLAK